MAQRKWISRGTFIAEIEACIAAGELTKAANNVHRQVPLASPKQVMDQLPAMFKVVRSTARVDNTGVRAEDMESIKEQMALILANQPRRSGAGPTAMRYEHLKPIAENAEGLALLTRLGVDFLQGRLAAGMQSCISTTRIVALLKPNNKIRPLGLGQVAKRT